MLKDPQTARDTFRLVADRVRLYLRPEKAFTEARMLRQLATFGGRLPLIVADVKVGYSLLAVGLEDEPDDILARRRTCREISDLLPSVTVPPDVKRLVIVLRHVIEQLGVYSPDIRRIIAREASELDLL